MEPLVVDLNGETELRIRSSSVRRIGEGRFIVGFEVYGVGPDCKEQPYMELLQEASWDIGGQPRLDQIVDSAAQVMIRRLSKLATALSCQYPVARPPG